MNFHQKRIISIFLSISLLSACLPIKTIEFSEFKEPEPEIYVSIMPAVLEYFFFRKQAVLSGDLNTFYQRYPELEFGTDIEKGINTESRFISNMHGLDPIDGNIHPAYYEKIKVHQSETGVQVLIHGMELYLQKNAQGEFSESGGEFELVLFMRQEGDLWQVYQTDEVTLQEWKGLER